jgi:molecular chaperone GrpE
VNDQRNTGAGAAPEQERGDDSTVNGGTGASDAANGGTSASAGAAAGEDFDSVRRQRDEYYDLLLRKTAEFDNYRRRIEKERRELSDYAAAELLRELLPLGDDLDRALAAAPDAPGADPAATLRGYRQGVELIQRQFGELLRKRGVTQVEALGADFDPHFHQAVTQEPSQTHREGEIIEEFSRGYKLGDRLLRPAMVKVATRE